MHTRARSGRWAAYGHGLSLLGMLLLLASEASAERVSLLNFDGSNARALRWRVAGALKRAGHTVVGVAPPKNPDDAEQLRAFAKRRRVDVFVGGVSEQGSDGLELTLTLMDADGEEIGRGLTFDAPNLRGMIRELKDNGQDRIDGAMHGKGSGTRGKKAARRDVDLDDPPAGDFAGQERARAKKKKGAASAPPVDEPIEVDEEPATDADESSDEEEAAEAAPARKPKPKAKSTADDATFDADEGDGKGEERTSEARSWTAKENEPASEDDGRESFLSGDAESGEVGADDAGSSDDDTAAATDDPTVLLGLNAGFVRRTLVYSDDLYSRLRAPSANSWVYRLQAAVYPFARPVKNRIGLIAGYESEFSGVVRDNLAGTDFGVTFSELYGGVQLRQPLGRHELALEGTVGSMTAGLDDPEGASGVPQFDYTSLRAAIDLGLHFGSLSVRTSLGYRLPIGGYGEASEAEWFPRMEGYGVEGNLGLSYRISKEVAFDVSGSMRRFLLQMNSQPEDATNGVSEVAGGAEDLYLGGYFGLNITL